MDEALTTPRLAPGAKLPHVPPPAVPDYRLLRRIGGGAYGEVWLARSQATGVLRAVKIVWRDKFDDERPFHREFEGIQKFERISREHPSQLALFHIGRNEEQGYFYYVIELADDVRNPREGQNPNGEQAVPSDEARSLDNYAPHTLRADLEQGRLPPQRVLEIGLALAEALSHLHQYGLVHRDVKPSNVIFVNGRPKLADIGLVTDASDQCSIVGTEGYLPPEGPGTPQADIFALGKVLYQAATGLDRRQFPDLPTDLKQWPERNAVLELNPIVLKACARDTRARYASAGEMETDLCSLRQGKSIRQQFRWRKRLAVARRAGLVILTLGVAAVASFAFWKQLTSPYDVSAKDDVNNLVKQGFAIVKSETPEQLNDAEKDFQEAKKLDSKFVPAYWGLFQVAINREAWVWNASPKAHQDIQELAHDLERIARNGAESHVAAAIIKWLDWKFAEALAEDREACRARAACREGRAAALVVYGFHLLQTGHPDEALAQYRLAERLDPTSPITEHHLGHPYFVHKDFEAALAHYKRSIHLEQRHTLGHLWVGRVYEEIGNFTNAIAELEQADQLRGKNVGDYYEKLREAVRQNSADPASAYWSKRLELAKNRALQDDYELATLYARLGSTNDAYTYLKQACTNHAFSQGPLFDSCWDKNDTNFQAIVRGIGLSVPIPR